MMEWRFRWLRNTCMIGRWWCVYFDMEKRQELFVAFNRFPSSTRADKE